jgi:hypothetical protein
VSGVEVGDAFEDAEVDCLAFVGLAAAGFVSYPIDQLKKCPDLLTLRPGANGASISNGRGNSGQVIARGCGLCSRLCGGRG